MLAAFMALLRKDHTYHFAIALFILAVRFITACVKLYRCSAAAIFLTDIALVKMSIALRSHAIIDQAALFGGPAMSVLLSTNVRVAICHSC